jgi:hypothetical protein
MQRYASYAINPGCMSPKDADAMTCPNAAAKQLRRTARSPGSPMVTGGIVTDGVEVNPMLIGGCPL